MSGKLLSFIIPAYNVEEYIDQCLESIYALGMDSLLFEVLVVDDGSTDRTPLCLQAWAQQHQNLRILTQSNQGQSVARNYGVQEAEGEYIYFVDGDDCLVAGAQLPFAEMESAQYDMIGVEVQKLDWQGRVRPYSRQRFPFGKVYESGMQFLRRHNVLGIVYGYVFRRRFLLDRSLRFTPGIYHQDEEFIVRAFCRAQRFVYVKGYIYIYIQHEGSSIHTFTESRRERLMNDMMVVLQHLHDERLANKAYDEAMHYKMSYMAVDVLRLLIRQNHRPEYAVMILEKLQTWQLFPLPWVSDWKYLLMKCLVCTPRSLLWWIKHQRIARLAGF